MRGGKTLKKGFPCWFPKWVYGEKINDKNFDLNDYFLKLENMFAEDMNALPNLKPFFEKGGKLLILQGKLDTIVPAEYVKEYYRELCNNIGGYQKTMESARLFLIPGAWHGNFKSNISAYIRGWVEENKAPEKIEVEVENKEQLAEALDAGADIIMLDNMTNEMMKECVKIVNGKALVEASGNMGEKKLRDVADTGVDIISIGALTHTIKSADISLKFSIS